MKKPQYSITFLDKPDEIMAYFLGIFTADGWIDKRDGGVFLSQIDKQIIHDIANKTEYKKPINKIYNKGYDNKIVTSYRLSYYYDIRIKMQQLGFTHLKTGHEFIPKCINDDIFCHFLRGLFDGDGTIGISKKNLATSAIISASKQFLEDILTYLKNKKIINSSKAKITSRNGTNKMCYRLRLAHTDTIKLCNYMYSSATIKLNYKYDIYIKAKKINIQNKTWSSEELNMLKNGIRPPNRAPSSISQKRKQLGIKART